MPRNKTLKRIDILKYIMFGALAIIAVRLFFIQIIEHDMWMAKAEEQHTILETITPKRGEIYVMDKGEPVPLVLNQTAYQVVIDPTVTKKEDIEKVVNEYVRDYTVTNLDEVYAQEDLRYAIVAKDVPRAVAEEIADAEIPAIWLKKTNQRVYPEGELAAAALGFVNNDGVGQYGVEGSLNEMLTGKEGLIKSKADINKVALSIGDDNIKIPAEDGKNVVLSIDRGLTRGIEEIATDLINNSVVTNASVLVMDPNNGEILTMANLPSYNPAEYAKVSDANLFLNQVIDVPYEPASICKNFTFSAAINEGVMTADTTYYNKGYEEVENWKIENAEKSPSLQRTMTMKDALYWSLNTGSIYALKLLGGNANEINQKGREKLYDYYHNRFRLGQETGVELIEAEGFVPDPNEGWGRNSTYANMTFGQNLGITMLQTASAFSAVINGGVYHTPNVVKGTYENGKLKEEKQVKDVNERIITEETSDTMRQMLINNRSYQKQLGADRDGYAVGGKSGTAQVIKDGAYDDTMSELVGSYIGFVGPNGELPKYVIMVKIWGKGQSIDGLQAMAFFNSVSNYLIDYLKIKPKG